MSTGPLAAADDAFGGGGCSGGLALRAAAAPVTSGADFERGWRATSAGLAARFSTGGAGLEGAFGGEVGAAAGRRVGARSGKRGSSERGEGARGGVLGRTTTSPAPSASADSAAMPARERD